MGFLTWLRERIGAEQAARRGRQRARTILTRPVPRWRPRLEALEDRCVPSTLAVTSSLDDATQHGTLRYAVAHAASGDTILLAADLKGTPIVLTQGELLLNQDVTIEGLPNKPMTISGGGTSRVFEVAANAHVTLSDLTITGGNASGTSGFDGSGGGVLNFGTLTVSGCTLSGNSAGGGGGIDNEGGTLTISGSTVSGNDGGGIINDFPGTLTVSGSIVSGNSGLDGGGIANLFGTLTVSGCTLSGNSAVDRGGGIFNVTDRGLGSAIISDTILSGNSAVDRGGGIYNDGSGEGSSSGGGTLTVSGCTLSGNSAGNDGGGIFTFFSTVTVSDTTLSGNSAGNDGGGIANGDIGFATLTVSGCTLSGNSAGNDGGGMYMGMGTATVSGCTFSGNSAGLDGGAGAISAPAAPVTVSNSVFCDNSPSNFGLYGIMDGGGNTFC